MIIMTSNLGASEVNELINGSMGFRQAPAYMDARLDDKINRTAVEAARRKFSPEFMNRIDKVVVFHMLRVEHLEQILQIELGMVQQRILQAAGEHQFVFSCTTPVKQLLLREGTDLKYGARHLKRAIEKHLVFPLANLVATGQIKLGDFIRVDLDGCGKLTFVKEAEGALVPVLLDRYGPHANAQAAATARGAKAAAGANGTTPAGERK
jgi:ATP-dependent Clp protease ATP-binding subunit ClpA